MQNCFRRSLVFVSSQFLYDSKCFLEFKLLLVSDKVRGLQQLRMKTVDKYQFNEQLFVLDDGMFVANHTILKRKFWLKMMSQGAENEKMAYNYLIKEAQVLKKLVHPNVYKCHKLLKSKNNFYVIYDFVEGDSLQNVLKGNLFLEHTKQIIETLLDIRLLHFIYLGLNMTNIMVDQSKKIVLKSFGFAEQFEEKAEEIDLPVFLGKMSIFSPPELERGKIYRNSDYYSLAILLSVLFAKQFEFGAKQSKEKQRIKNDNLGINVELDIQLLRQLTDKLAVKNAAQRGDLVQLLKSYAIPTFVSGMSLAISRKSTNFSPSKSVRNQGQSSKDLMIPHIPALQRSKSFKNFDPSSSEKKEANFSNVEQLVLYIFKKRNFVLLLLNISSACIRNKEASISTSLILSFLLVKKATTVISQLAKLIKQGSNNEISLNVNLKAYFHKTKIYQQLSVLINKEMLKSQKSFQELLAQIKEVPEFLKNEALQAEVRYQKINQGFIKRMVLEFLLQLSFLATDQYVNQYECNELNYFYLMSLLSDYDSYEDMHAQLLTEGIEGVSKEPLFVEMNRYGAKKMVQLIQHNINLIFSEQNYRSPLAVKNALTAK